jgi:hypothetical protein
MIEKIIVIESRLLIFLMAWAVCFIFLAATHDRNRFFRFFSVYAFISFICLIFGIFLTITLFLVVKPIINIIIGPSLSQLMGFL